MMFFQSRERAAALFKELVYDGIMWRVHATEQNKGHNNKEILHR